MAKEFDRTVLNTTITRVVQETFKKMLHVDPQGQPAIVQRDIIEYDSRMRVFPLEKFNGPAYVSYVNLYLSEKELQANNAAGAFVLFVKEDIAEKLLKAFGRSLKDGEDEGVLMEHVGKFCHVLVEGLLKELTGLGYTNLFLSTSFQARNSVPEGVPFDYELYVKQEITFTFWNQKCIVVEACLGPVPPQDS